jgi:hypothetical protein
MKISEKVRVTESGCVMEAADDLLAAVMRAEDDGMIEGPRNTITHTEADEAPDERAYEALRGMEL